MRESDGQKIARVQDGDDTAHMAFSLLDSNFLFLGDLDLELQSVVANHADIVEVSLVAKEIEGWRRGKEKKIYTRV